jgi:hypothetical protein
MLGNTVKRINANAIIRIAFRKLILTSGALKRRKIAQTAIYKRATQTQ